MVAWQVLQLPEAQNVIGVPWLPSHAGNMLRVPTMGCGYADPRDLRQQSEDLHLGSNMRHSPF